MTRTYTSDWNKDMEEIMTDDKMILIEQMKSQRFLPVTEDTLPLYDKYEAMIDVHDPDELSHLLFYKGEYFFRIGQFKEALNYLTRCLSAPKQKELKYLDALCYNIIGIIYAFLQQESIAINTLLLGKDLSQELHWEHQFSICCTNLGLLHSRLNDYKCALEYFDLGLAHAQDNVESSHNLSIVCHAYRGIIYCKMGDRKAALKLYEKILHFTDSNDRTLLDAAILDFKIRMFDFLDDSALLSETLTQLFNELSNETDFLESSEFYFDICSYLIAHGRKTDAFKLLSALRETVEKLPLAFLRHTCLQQEVSYHRAFSSPEEYLHACSQLFEIRPAYLHEQRYAKLYNLEFTEHLRQTKNDSEMYRQKSQLDQMTGLLNKYTIHFLIMEELAKSTPDAQSAMILIDMDHFKQINDTLGHLAGDNFICQTAAIIRECFRDTALCGRVGGDEFLVYLSNITDVSFVVLQAEILRQEIYRRISERNITVTTQASIGISFSSEYCYDYESLFAAADHALYRAKMSGRNKVVVADE